MIAFWRPAREKPRPVGVEGIALVDVEAARIARADLGERRQATRIALDGDDAARALEKKGARQPARTGTDLDHRAPFEGASEAGDAPREIEIEDEILPEALLGPEPVGGDDLAQGRESVRARSWSVGLIPRHAAPFRWRRRAAR